MQITGVLELFIQNKLSNNTLFIYKKNTIQERGDFMILIIIKLICLLFAVWFGFINVSKVIYGHSIPSMNIFIMSLGIVGFVSIQFNLI